MPKLFHRLILPCLLASLGCALPALAQVPPAGGAQEGQAAPPRQAGYVVLSESVVPVTLQLTGRATAYNSTQLRPRVSGEVTEILYQAGRQVQAGQPLFQIDRLTYELALSSAEASKASAEAALAEARLAYNRATQLSKSAASSQAAQQSAEATLRKAEATLRSADSALDLAKAQLEWTTIRSPINGTVGVAQVSVGDLVTQNQTTALTEIVQSAPIYLDLNEPWPVRLREEARAAAGEITLLAQPKLTVLAEDGRAIGEGATLLSTGSTVASTTGTRTLRFEFANEHGLIAPGAFLHTRMVIAEQKAILVPQRASTRERDGSLSAWVEQDGKAQKRKLVEAGSYGNDWIITAGLSVGEKLLIDGTTNLRDGQALTLIAAEIDENGVVRDLEQAAVKPEGTKPHGDTPAGAARAAQN